MQIFREDKCHIERVPIPYKKMIRDSKLIIKLLFIHFKISELEDTNAATQNKPIADHTTLKSPLYCLLVCDEARFQHEHMRVQLALSMLIMTYTGLRPGTILESMYHRQWNGLRYKHVEVNLVQVKGIVRLTLALKFRNCNDCRHGNQGYVEICLPLKPVSSCPSVMMMWFSEISRWRILPFSKRDLCALMASRKASKGSLTDRKSRIARPGGDITR